MFKIISALLMFGLFSTPVMAAPRAYEIDYGASQIGFVYLFNGEEVKGSFPKFKGDLVLDFQNIKNSKIDVTIETRTAKGGFVFATSALRGLKVLNVKNFPTIKFTSQSAQMSNGVAKIKGDITVRGVTRPLTLTAKFFQLQGQDPKDRENLVVQISGTINRHDFGASGFPKMVGDTLAITIKARINRRP